MKTFLRNRPALLVFVGPPLLLYILIILVPIIWSIIYTFYKGSPISGFEFSGIQNYIHLFHDPNFTSSFWISIKYTVVVTAGQVIFGLILALLYVFYIKRLNFLVRTLCFFPVILPTVAVSQMFDKLFAISPQMGLINSILQHIGLHSLVIPWLGQQQTAFWVLCLMDVWKAIGFYAVILYTGLMDIPEDVLEAAKLDGARGWKLTRFVVLPLLRPILISSIIFSLNGTLKVFDSVLALTNGGPGSSTTTLTLYMYQTAFNYNQYGYGSTIAVFLLVECLVVTLLVYRFARKSVA